MLEDETHISKQALTPTEDLSGTPEQSENPKVGAKYEHLFPGSNWKELSLLHPLNVPQIFPGLVFTEDTNDKFWEAKRRRRGFAKRINFKHPDKTLVGFYLLSLELVDEGFPRERVEELLREGEELGGFAIRPTSRAVDNPDATLKESFFEPTLETDFIRVAGILGSDNKPQGLIFYKEGFRPEPHRGKSRLKIPGLTPGQLIPKPGTT